MEILICKFQKKVPQILFFILSILITLKTKYGIALLIIQMSFYGSLLISKKLNISLERFIAYTFVLTLPFFYDLNLIYQPDYHVVSKVYYKFNFSHVFIPLFIYIIYKNRNLIKMKMDLWILLAFNMLQLMSAIYAINPVAAFVEFTRYIVITLAYIFFSRIFDYRSEFLNVQKIFIGGAVFQLLIGFGQKLNNGSIGLRILGEARGKNVFRVGVYGYEKGMSGTFLHPGPYAIFALFILGIVLFSKELNKRYRIIGIIATTLIIIFAAGRTSIMLMVILYLLYLVGVMINAKKFGVKNEKQRNKKQKKVIAIAVLSCSILSMVLLAGEVKPIVDRFTKSDMKMQLRSRLRHVEIAVGYIKQSPILGHGLNNYLDLTKRDNPKEYEKDFFLNTPIHNVYLLYAVEIGVLGMSLFILFIGNNIRYAIKALKVSNNKEQNRQLMGSVAIIFIYCVYNLQGWAGIQSRILIMFILLSAFIYQEYTFVIEENSNVKGLQEIN